MLVLPLGDVRGESAGGGKGRREKALQEHLSFSEMHHSGLSTQTTFFQPQGSGLRIMETEKKKFAFQAVFISPLLWPVYKFLISCYRSKGRRPWISAYFVSVIMYELIFGMPGIFQNNLHYFGVVQKIKKKYEP